MVPTPTLIGALIIGILLGRSVRFMSGMAKLHTAAHSRSDASAVALNRNQTVVVVDGSGTPIARTDRSELSVERTTELNASTPWDRELTERRISLPAWADDEVWDDVPETVRRPDHMEAGL